MEVFARIVGVTNSAYLLLPHFYFKGAHFRDEFNYIVHLGYQKIEFRPTLY